MAFLGDKLYNSHAIIKEHRQMCVLGSEIDSPGIPVTILLENRALPLVGLSAQSYQLYIV